MNEAAAPVPSQSRHHYSLEQKADYLERFLQSGLSAEDFCRQAHLAPSCLQRWLKLLEPARPEQTRSGPELPLFQELALPGPAAAPACWSVELSRANGTVLRLAQPVSAQLLEQLLAVC